MKTTKADLWFSKFIRLRDTWEDGYCRCITCGKIQHPKEADCGHYIKRQHNNTRFNEINCAAQCGRCNRFEQGRDTIFRNRLIEKHGIDKILLLESSKREIIKMTQYKLDYLAALYKQKATELSRVKGIALWILLIFFAIGCEKEPQLVCYECWSADSTIHEYFIDTDEATMQHTIDWWASRCEPMILNCKIIKP